MHPNDHAQLLAAANDARADDWADWELPELIFAAARSLRLSLSPAQAAAIAAEALGHPHDLTTT